VKKWLPLTIAILLAVSTLVAEERLELAPDTRDKEIKWMHPKNIDPSQLPLDSIDELRATGSPQAIDINTWRLKIEGKTVSNPIALRYEELMSMPMVKKKVILICPGVFVNYAEWEGVLLNDVLQKAGINNNFRKLSFVAKDGYSRVFSREEFDELFLMLAVKVNGVPLPDAHGFPVRLVAGDVYGGRWVKWITKIEVR
jgi:sulfoxide reductase catalytic subunit YedY